MSLDRPDPGGVFNTEEERRVLGHLPTPDLEPHSSQLVAARVAADPHTYSDEPIEVLKDLEARGYCRESGEGWAMTKSGFEAIQAPPPEPGGGDQAAQIGGAGG